MGNYGENPTTGSLKRDVSKEIIATIAYSLLFCGITAVPGIAVMTQKAHLSLLGFLMVIPSLILFSARRLYVASNKKNITALNKNFIKLAYTLIYVAVALVFTIAFLRKSGLVITFVLELAFYAYASSTYANNRRSKGKSINIGGGFIVVSAALFVVASYATYRAANVFIDLPLSIALMIIISCFMLNRSMSNIDSVLNETEIKTIVPSESIIKLSNMVSVILACAISFAVLIIRIVLGNRSVLALYSLLNGVIAFFSWINNNPEMQKSDASPTAPTSQPTITTDAEAVVQIDSSSNGGINFNELIFRITVGIALAAVLAGFIVLAYVLCKRILNKMKKSDDETDDIEYNDEKFYIKGDGISMTNLFKRFVSMFSLRNQIRRAFYKKVSNYNRQDKIVFKNYDTADEMSRKIAEFEDVEALNRAYNKARYSSAEITKDEISSCS